MNKKRKVLITITYNEMGIIIDTKAEEVAQPNLQPTCNQLVTDCISRQAAIDEIARWIGYIDEDMILRIQTGLKKVPSAQPEDYTELKREFIRMASYIDELLECSDEQRETLVGFISRLAGFMPWTERD